ncbi:MAG: carbamoyltransferase [Myxococcota bacterium]|nr:carbamoyltransferase [Myxococcota bacterium]
MSRIGSDHLNILGISAYYHDSAACLIRDGEVVAAAQEERFSRRKADPAFPTQAAEYCLREAGLTSADLDLVGFYDKPGLKFERILETHMQVAPRGFSNFVQAMPLWLREKWFVPHQVQKALGYKGEVLFAEHHESHAASAFYPSPFEEAAILTLDGVGEWTTASWGIGRGNELDLKQEIRFPHSLGLLYSAFTYFTGFRVNFGEYKVMGLAPYGEPRYADRIFEHLIDIAADGSFSLDLAYFDFLAGDRMTSDKFDALFGGPAREPESPITQREMDIARSIQVVVEEVLLRQARHVHRETGMRNLVLAGGVALNCVANGRLLREGPFDELWIQPAAGDAGGALGVALLLWHRIKGKPRASASGDRMSASLLGPAYGEDEIQTLLGQKHAIARRLGEQTLVEETAELLARGNVVGWFQGRMEFGPRALGSRSILGDPRNESMQRTLNMKIKFRESFRPFAPAVLRERVADYFELERDSPYMLLVADLQVRRRLPVPADASQLQGLDRLRIPRSDIPAVTHVDYSARIQTVDEEQQPLFHALLRAFERRTGCPILVNTSFNVRGEPIVCTPEDAWRCFLRTDMDYLVLGPFLLDKRSQPKPEEELAAGPLALD